MKNPRNHTRSNRLECLWCDPGVCIFNKNSKSFWCTLQFKNLCSSVQFLHFVQVLTFKTLCMVRCFLWKNCSLYSIFHFSFFRTQVKYLLLLRTFLLGRLIYPSILEAITALYMLTYFFPLMKDEVLDWEKQYFIFFPLSFASLGRKHIKPSGKYYWLY